MKIISADGANVIDYKEIKLLKISEYASYYGGRKDKRGIIAYTYSFSNYVPLASGLTENGANILMDELTDFIEHNFDKDVVYRIGKVNFLEDYEGKRLPYTKDQIDIMKQIINKRKIRSAKKETEAARVHYFEEKERFEKDVEEYFQKEKQFKEELETLCTYFDSIPEEIKNDYLRKSMLGDNPLLKFQWEHNMGYKKYRQDKEAFVNKSLEQFYDNNYPIWNVEKSNLKDYVRNYGSRYNIRNSVLLKIPEFDEKEYQEAIDFFTELEEKYDFKIIAYFNEEGYTQEAVNDINHITYYYGTEFDRAYDKTVEGVGRYRVYLLDNLKSR